MERLKEAALGAERCMQHIFTFQYGEIKSLFQQPAACGVCLFTFQYGEIKRHMRRAQPRHWRAIYIPVWRD